jgi:4-hydroxy-tetrahydrodipicolinate synthase
MKNPVIDLAVTRTEPSCRSAAALPGGVWPVILTPFDSSRAIDWNAYDRLIDWYIENGASGLFAACLSSEMFFLTLEERVALVRRAVRRAGPGIPVVASGALGAFPLDVAEHVKALSDSGPAAVVLLTNQGSLQAQAESAFRRTVETILQSVPDVDLGLYECPEPYKRLLSPAIVRELAQTGRFVFFKETSCQPALFSAKVQAAAGTRLGVYNADNPTLLASLQAGGHGYSGIAASGICAELSALCRVWSTEPEEARELQNVIGPASVILGTRYPASAKYYLRDILGDAIECRWMDAAQLSESDRQALDQLALLMRSRTFR